MESEMKTIVLALLAMATAACSRANVLPSADGKAFSLLAETDPVAVSRRLTDQFLRTRPENYCPPGYRGNGYCDDGYGGGKHVQYAVVSIWANALECARQAGDTAREDRLIRLYDDFLPGGSKHAICPRPYHVDDAIFGSLALQIYLRTKDPRHLAEGLRYADAQWTPPCDATVKERHAASMELQEEYWKAGYTPQTRLWIDDMYMITALQSQAYRATGDRKYIERAAKEMCLYLDRLQLKGGPASGLFYHAPDVPFVWGRGDGWMAAGMAMTLKYLPADSEWRERILSGYVAMMEALLKFQRPDGMWCQLVNEPDADGNWPESSCTAMFAYAFIVGVKNGWLEAERFGKPAQKAWIELCRRLDENANVPDVCCGTGKFNDRSYYFNRIRVHGDPHGQAPLLWCAAELIGSPISGDAARAHDIDLKPTFTSCGVEYPSSSPVPGIQLECRRAMSGWTAVDGAEFPYFKSDGVYRGSLRNLDENTSYAVRITSRGKVLAEGKFRTWKSDVPIARTVELAADGHLPKIVSETGASGGWVRIVAKDGGVLDFGECAETPIVVDGAKYVVFDGLRIRGSRARNVFKIANSRFVRIRNCDISHWGRIGEPRFDKFGRFFEADDESDWGINFDGAIEIGNGAFGCVVERCWIHDPRGRANSWFYSHPAGPEAVVVNRPKGSTVIRWNDFTSSDLHRYNDAVEGLGNFRLDGGFNRDADIYGNFMAFCNDDCIELDGGQRNVRCFGNRFEAALCGVSVQGCMKGTLVCIRQFVLRDVRSVRQIRTDAQDRKRRTRNGCRCLRGRQRLLGGRGWNRLSRQPEGFSQGQHILRETIRLGRQRLALVRIVRESPWRCAGGRLP